MLITMKINDFDKRVMEILGKGGKSGQELATAGNFNYNTTRTCTITSMFFPYKRQQ